MFESQLKGPVAELAYIVGRAVAGCPTFMELVGTDSAEECFANAVVFGEWEPAANVQQMPKAVVVQSEFTGKSETESEGNFVSTGTVTVLVYFKPNQQTVNESFQELEALSICGELIKDLFLQGKQLNNEGSQFTGKTYFLNQIDLLGPTRTLKTDRGPDGENDYFDAAFMLQIG